MKTNLKTIVKFDPCDEGITKLMNNLGHICVEENWEDVYNSLTPEQQTKDIDFKFILKSNGVKDTFWGLCTQPEKIRMLIGADVVESVLHIYEEKYPNDMRVRDCIQGIRDYCNGKITKAKLNILKIDAADAAYDAAAYDAAADTDTYAVYVVADAAYDAVNATSTVVYAVVNAAYTARKEQWKKNEVILLKYI